MEKSHVGFEQKLCGVCNRAFDSGVILLDKRMLPSLDKHTITGYDLCPEHKKLHEQGFIALVECDPEQTPGAGDIDAKVKLEDAFRTGVKREVAGQVFLGITEEHLNAPMMWIDPEATKVLKKMQEQAEAQDDAPPINGDAEQEEVE